MQVQGFCTAEGTINQTKRQWEKMFAGHVPDLGLVDTLWALWANIFFWPNHPGLLRKESILIQSTPGPKPAPTPLPQ